METVSFLEMSLTGGLLIVVIIIVRAVALYRLPKRVFPTLWALALCRLLLPFTIPSPTSIYAAANVLSLVQQRPGIVNAAPVGAAAAISDTAAAASFPILPSAWGLGVSILAALFLFSHFTALRRYRASLPVETPLISAWLADHPLRRKIAVRYSDQIDTPLTYGLIRPVILLPKAVCSRGAAQVVFVLAHEHTHIRRFDTFFKWLLAGALCLHWFNPLVWAMYLLASRDLELACDEAVIRMYGSGVRSDYARALLDLEERRTHFLPLCSAFSKNALAERIGAVMRSKTFSRAALLVAVVLVASITAVFATSAQHSEQGPEQQAVANYGLSAVLDKAIGTASTQHASLFRSAYEQDFSLKKDPKTGHYYTQEQYDTIAALKVAGYEDLSISQFNRTIHAALSSDDEALARTYEMVLSDLPEDDPLAHFLLNTVQASLTEYSARLYEAYSGTPQDPSFSGRASRTESANIYGDLVEIGWTDVSYSFSYRILEQDKLTVRERDAFLQSILDGMQHYLSALDASNLKDHVKMEKALVKELDRLGKQASSPNITYTGGKLLDYYSESMRDEYREYDGSIPAVTEGAQ